MSDTVLTATAPAGPTVTSTTRAPAAGWTGPRQVVGFLLTFLVAWGALDLLVSSPPTPLTTLTCLAVAGGTVALGERIVFRTAVRDIPRDLGLGRPRPAAVAVGGIVGGLVFATYLVGAAALDVDLQIRSDWPVVLACALLFHGLTEELVWRGFVFAHLRDATTFGRAVGWSVPLIALTHVPIIAGKGPVIGAMAVTSAAVTCLPMAHLWEHGGRTIWGPAALHGLIGTWQLFERDFPDSFSIVLVTGSIVVPLLALLWRPPSPTTAP